MPAFRSCSVQFESWTKHAFKRTGFHLDHGTWSDNQSPPEMIPAVKLEEGEPVPGTAHFAAESDGVATGVAGHVDYVSTDDDKVSLHVHFSNPTVGANSFDVEVKGVKATWGDPSGNHMDVTVTLRRAAP